MMEPSAGAEEFESSYLGKDVKLCGRFALSPRGAPGAKASCSAQTVEKIRVSTPRCETVLTLCGC